MNIISSYKLLLILIIQAIHGSEQMTLIKESSSIDICKGNDVDLLWKVNEEENKISKLEWYFNNKMICTSSPVDDFTVNTPYQGRIERIDKTGIRLNNVSLDDEGIYILFPLLAWSTSQNMQKIVLRVLEPPTNKCTCKTGHPSNFTCEVTTSYCGRPQVSLVWKRSQTFEVVGEGNCILINSSLRDNEILCCQNGEAMKCVNDSRQFCTSVSIPHRDDERPSEGRNIQRTDLVTMPVSQDRDSGSTNHPYVLVTLTLSTLAIIFSLAVLIIKWRKRRTNQEVEEILHLMKLKHEEPLMKHDPVFETEESVTVHQTTNDSEFEIEVQKLQHSAIYPTLEKEEALSEHQPSLNLKTMKEMQELHQASLYPTLEKEEALSEHQPSLYLKPMKEMQELHQASLCKICFANEMSVVFMPCSHFVTCTNCSIALQECPACGALIKMKINNLLAEYY